MSEVKELAYELLERANERWKDENRLIKERNEAELAVKRAERDRRDAQTALTDHLEETRRICRAAKELDPRCIWPRDSRCMQFKTLEPLEEDHLQP
jgi:hypothetical protein